MITNNGLHALDHEPLPEFRPDAEQLQIFGKDGETAKKTALGDITELNVTRAIAFVDGSGIVDRMTYLNEGYQDALRGARAKAGRPAILSFRQVMLLMFITIFDGRAPLGTIVGETAGRMRDSDLARIGLKRAEVERPGFYDQIVRTIHRFLQSVDPYPSPRQRRMTPDGHKALLEEEKADVTGSVATMRARLDWFVEALLEATWLTLPEQVRARYHGNLAGDGTRVDAGKLGTRP